MVSAGWCGQAHAWPSGAISHPVRGCNGAECTTGRVSAPSGCSSSFPAPFLPFFHPDRAKNQLARPESEKSMEFLVHLQPDQLQTSLWAGNASSTFHRVTT